MADAEVTPAVRCCADGAETTCSTAGVVEPPPPAPLADGQCTSRASCAELKADYGGWTVKTVRVEGFTGWRVCGESDNGLGDDSSNECRGGSAVGVADGHTRTVANTDVSGWAHATSICMGAGARLCTITELASEVTRGSGCQHDAEWLWTQDECDGGHMTNIGSKAWGNELCPDDCPTALNCLCEPRCANDNDSAPAVRCCADEDTTIADTCTAPPAQTSSCVSDGDGSG